MATTYAHVNPTVLRWARESAGYDINEAARRIGVRWSALEAAEDGADLLTLRQAEKAADLYDRALATLFVPQPPQEEPQEAVFRRLPGAPALPWSPQMRLLARRVQNRQDAARGLYEELDEPPPWPAASRLLVDSGPEALPARTRAALAVSLEEQLSWTDGYSALRAWTDGVERLGVLVMQDGSMPVHVFRGFAARDNEVPVVVANSKDDERARAWTVIHELGHLVLDLNELRPRHAEQWLDDFTGEILVPSEHLSERFSATTGSPLRRVDTIARSFSVTPMAAAVRLRKAALLPRTEAEQVIETIRRRAHPRPGPAGGNPYRNQIAWLGPTYIGLVLAGLDSQALTYPAASRLLNRVKVNNLGKLREALAARSARS